jgi:hypothetical protein
LLRRINARLTGRRARTFDMHLRVGRHAKVSHLPNVRAARLLHRSIARRPFGQTGSLTRVSGTIRKIATTRRPDCECVAFFVAAEIGHRVMCNCLRQRKRFSFSVAVSFLLLGDP